MPDTAPAPAVTDVRAPNVPSYPPAFTQQEPPPNGVLGSALRESGGLLRVLKDVPASTLTLLGLLGVVGALVYGVIWVHPQTQREMMNEWIRSSEDQNEMNRAMYREERTKSREQNKAILDGVVRLEKAIDRWEKK